ncbi:hypothetical protein CVT24_010165 [Panaeolus cyanescens]|uniref:Uncharacterized protein n=1 Tax=Panaeolus cyanescens TaxID=181874 RepID=A0A409YW61_9AGAR|nr:hypothetical protein CVT24_010165 [Panaeolus cyanescens]
MTSSLVGTVGNTLDGVTGIVGNVGGDLISDAGQAVTTISDKMDDFPPTVIDIVDPKPKTIYDYQVYKPTTNARVYAGKRAIYVSPGDEAMYGVVNRYLEAINWVQLVTWTNDTNATQQYQYSYTTSLKVTTGSEVTIGMNLGLSYEGMSIGINGSQKSFQSFESTTTKTTTITVNVAPRATVGFYQKRYDFRDEITFINDAWGQEWNAGPWGGYTPLTKKICQVQVMADEYFTADKVLAPGPGACEVDSVIVAKIAGWTRKRENLTARCKDRLRSMGL